MSTSVLPYSICTAYNTAVIHHFTDSLSQVRANLVNSATLAIPTNGLIIVWREHSNGKPSIPTKFPGPGHSSSSCHTVPTIPVQVGSSCLGPQMSTP